MSFLSFCVRVVNGRSAGVWGTKQELWVLSNTWPRSCILLWMGDDWGHDALLWNITTVLANRCLRGDEVWARRGLERGLL